MTGKARRRTHTRVSGVWARCDDCPFNMVSRNAIGLAAQHADKNPEHTVRGGQTLWLIFNRKG